MADLRDKVVVVTGGSGGLGRALASAFARQGYRVVITARDIGKLQAAARDIAKIAAPVLALSCDIKEKDQVERLAQEVGMRLGTVHLLVNNAGIARAESLLNTTDNLWDQSLRTNLTGAYYCCKVFLPAMISSGWGAESSTSRQRRPRPAIPASRRTRAPSMASSDLRVRWQRKPLAWELPSTPSVRAISTMS